MSLYTQSSIVEKLKKTRRIFFFDIDGTLSYRMPQEKGWQQELAARKKIKNMLSSYPTVAITMRTPDLVLDEDSLPDFDVIAGIGSGICVRHSDHFVFDEHYIHYLGINKNWREETLEVLQKLDSDFANYLAPIEYPENFDKGITNVYPLPYRIQMNFNGDEGLSKKMALTKVIRAHTNLCVIDESRSQEEFYSIYILPKLGSKEKTMDYSMTQLGNYDVYIAGDTFVDLRMLAFAQLERNITFLLAGGSRITPYLQDTTYAGESLDWLKPYLNREIQSGVYEYTHPLGGHRTLIIGDIAFPNTLGPETVLAWLEESKKKTKMPSLTV
jgi:hydroxymethylpyrimidine pyrophosphatase-like HAD family hydrolase